jgi:hypothetical protein
MRAKHSFALFRREFVRVRSKLAREEFGLGVLVRLTLMIIAIIRKRKLIVLMVWIMTVMD